MPASLSGSVLALSTRKVGEILLPLLGHPLSAATVNRVAKNLHTALASFLRRPLKDVYEGSCSTVSC